MVMVTWYRSRWACGISGALLCANLLAAGGEGTGLSSEISSLEMIDLEPEQLQLALGAAKTSYRGDASDELLVLLELVQRELLAPAEDFDAGSKQAYATSIELIVDLLYEWPSSDLYGGIAARLKGGDTNARRAALLAAVASADDPRVEKLLWVVATGSGNVTERVLAILALGETGNPVSIKDLANLRSSKIDAIREAASQAIRNLRTAYGKSDVALLDRSVPVPSASVVGPSLFGDYRSIPIVPIGSEKAEIVVVGVGPRSRRPFTKQVLNTMTQALSRDGTVLIWTSTADRWSGALAAWAEERGIVLPSMLKSAYGNGVINHKDYCSLADRPFSLRDQPGIAATHAWASWADTDAAPILTVDRNGALVVVHRDRTSKGRIVFAAVDLAKRPIYRENILRWIYGDALLAHALDFAKNYEFRVGGYTPHKVWAKPIAGRKPRILYLTSSYFKRGLMELLQRMDADWRYVPYDATVALPAKKNTRAPARMSQRAVALLEGSLSWADIVVFDVGERNLAKSLTQEIKGLVSLDIVPSRLRRRIYRRVHADSRGLLGISSPRAAEGCIQEFVARVGKDDGETSEFLAFANPILPFPKAVDEGAYSGVALRAAVSGKGRLLWYNQRLPHSHHATIPELRLNKEYAVPGLLRPLFPVMAEEYWYALLVKSVLWAAVQDADKPNIVRLGFSQKVAGKSGTLEVVLDRGYEGTVEYVFRDPYNNVDVAKSFAVHGRSAVAQVPPRSAGWHILEVLLKDKAGKVVDFGAVRVRVSVPTTIVEIRAGKLFYKEGETANLSVKLSSDFSGKARVDVVDTYGRRVFEKLIDCSDVRDISIAVPVINPLSRMWDVHVYLIVGGHTLSHLRQPIGIELSPEALDFDVACPIVSPRTHARFFKEQMGVNVTYGDPDTALRQNLRLSSGCWSDAIGASTTPGARLDPREREPCLSSPSFRIRAILDVREKGPRFRSLGITDYMIDDECPLGGRCFAPDCLFRFRNEMRRMYGTLDSLNKEWGATYKEWEQVMPCESVDSDRPGSTVDFDKFTRWVFAEYCSFLEMLAGDYVPNFKAGHSGGIRGNMMMRYAGSLYYYGVTESAVSVKRSDAVIGSWYAPGYRFVENHETTSRHWPWWHLFRGTTRMQIWYPSAGGGAPAYHEDMSRPFAAFEWLTEEMTDIRRGIGKLLLHCKRDEGPAAIYNSQRSALVIDALKEMDGRATGRRASFGNLYPKMKGDLQRALLDQQVECRFVSEYLVEEGALKERGIKLLFLPGVVSLSRRERGALLAFVEDGGVLVADANTGLRNEHGTMIGSGFARNVFGVDFKEGVARVESNDGKPAEVTFVAKNPSFPFERLRDAVPSLVEMRGIGVRVADGTALAAVDGEPAVIVKQHGEGKCVFLNFRVPGNAAFAGALAADMVDLAGLSPVVSVISKGGVMESFDFGIFRNGAEMYVGFVERGKGGMVADEKARDVTVMIPGKRYLYDARAGSYLGQRSSHQINLTPGIAKVYACLPYRLESLRLAKDANRYQPGGVVSISLDVITVGAQAGLNVVNIVVRDPSDRIHKAYGRRLSVRNGRGVYKLPLPLNAAQGSWTVDVRDAATGVAAHMTFVVGEAR